MKYKNIHTQEVYIFDRTEVVFNITVTVLKDSKGEEWRCDADTMKHFKVAT